MSDSNPSVGSLRSSFADDPDWQDIITMYVQEMPARIEQLHHHFAANDCKSLARLAHQIKGSAGSYGFHQLTAPAAELERAANGAVAERVERAFDALIQICRGVCQ